MGSEESSEEEEPRSSSKAQKRFVPFSGEPPVAVPNTRSRKVLTVSQAGISEAVPVIAIKCFKGLD